MKSLSKLLNKEWLLITIYYIFIIDLVGYFIYGNYVAIALLLIIALITAQFSRHFSVIMAVPTVLVTLYVFGGNILYYLFGSKTSEGMESMEKKDEKKNEKTDESKTDLAINPPLEKVESDENVNVQSKEESFETGRKKGGNYNVDYAATVEDAYDELNKIIDSDGIKKLTADTQNLMNQQLKLAEAMKSMQPMIDTMAPFIQKAEGFFGGFSKKV